VSVVLVYTVDCGTCGGEATSRVLDLSNPQDDGTIRIDLEMASGDCCRHCQAYGTARAVAS
jgi:hypothetical protein